MSTGGVDEHIWSSLETHGKEVPGSRKGGRERNVHSHLIARSKGEGWRPDLAYPLQYD